MTFNRLYNLNSDLSLGGRKKNDAVDLTNWEYMLP